MTRIIEKEFFFLSGLRRKNLPRGNNNKAGSYTVYTDCTQFRKEPICTHVISSSPCLLNENKLCALQKGSILTGLIWYTNMSVMASCACALQFNYRKKMHRTSSPHPSMSVLTIPHFISISLPPFRLLIFSYSSPGWPAVILLGKCRDTYILWLDMPKSLTVNYVVDKSKNYSEKKRGRRTSRKTTFSFTERSICVLKVIWSIFIDR